jgi:DNA-binding transcriptional ArsR family regulator
MNRLIELKDRLIERLPILGILAFSLCSVNSVAHLFTANAKNPTGLLWFAAGLVEVTTAWIVHQVVDNGRKVTRSNISKQDRRFYGGVLAAFVVLAIPSLSLSIAANTLEFGDLRLGIQFPLLSVACAVGSAVPITVARFEKAKAKARQEADKKRKDKESKRKQEQAQGNVLSTLGKAGETLALFADNPALSQASAAQALSISRQAVGQHLRKLEALGLVSRDNGGVEVLVDLPANDNGREATK